MFLFLGLAIVLSGCMKKSEIAKIIQRDKIYEKALIYTKENQLVSSLETKATITATLLNEVFPKRFKYDEGISFFVGVISDMPLDLSKNIFLDEKTPIGVRSIGQKDPLYILMPSVNRWGSYYIVTFPSINSRFFTLKLRVDPYDSIKLNFQRLTLRR